MDTKTTTPAPAANPGQASQQNPQAHITTDTTALPVAFTRFDSANPVTKVYSLVDAEIKKSPAAQMTTGEAHRIEYDFRDFKEMLDAMEADQATGYGLHDCGQYGKTAHIVVAERAKTPCTIARTKEFFQFHRGPGILMIDHDPSPYGHAATGDELLAILAGISPVFACAACLTRGSVSSGVHRAGQPPRESAGFHLYFAVKDASDIPRFGAVLFKRLWLAGHGFIALSKSGAMLVRALIDSAVFSGERLDFVGKPVIPGDGLEYTPPKAEYRDGGYLDTSALPGLTEAEEAKYQRLVAAAKARMQAEAEKVRGKWIEERTAEMVERGTPEPEARRQLERIANGEAHDLPPGFVLHFATLGPATVAEVLANPGKYDGQALADPIEGVDYGRTTAKFYANEGGKPCINSFAHGGMKYFPKPCEAWESSGGESPSASASTKKGVDLVCAADIAPAPIRWLWRDWLARGKLHILAGPAGTGKTTIALSVAAIVTCGGRWPDGTQAEAGNVLIWSGEDSPQDTLLPRLIAAGADRRRVYFVDGVCEEGKNRLFDPATDMDELTKAANKIGNVKLLIVDPIVSAVGGDSHKNSKTRRALQPLVDLGAALDCAILGISHFSKGTAGRDPVERVTGSLAFGALARIVLAAAKLPDDKGGGRLLVRAKSNIGLDSGGFKYDLEQIELEAHPGVSASRVKWGERLDGTARDLLDQAETSGTPEERTALEEAKEFLRSCLVNGRMEGKKVKADAGGAGMAWRTVERAKAALNIKSEKEGANWYWHLPGSDCADDAPDLFEVPPPLHRQCGDVSPTL